jgi:hypothetical protein
LAVLQAKLYLYSPTTDTNDMLDTYALLGDPALQLASYSPLDLALVLESSKKIIVNQSYPERYQSFITFWSFV